MLTDAQLDLLHTRSSMHLPDVKLHKFASCFHCLKFFHSRQVEEFVDDGATAVCPKCRIDAVLPGKYPKDVLKQMRARFFGDE